MSKAQLKKALSGMEASDIAEMVVELYENRPEAKEYLEFWLNPDAGKELEKYKVKLHRLFFTSQGKTKKRPTITSVKKVLKYFSTLCYDPELVAELYLYLCDVDIVWIASRRNAYGSVKSMRENIAAAAEYVEKSGLEESFAIRLECIGEKADEAEELALDHQSRRSRRWLW